MASGIRPRDRARVRRLLQAMPDEVGTQINQAYARHAPAILAYARGEVPSRTGKLRAALAFKLQKITKSRPFGGLRIGLLTKRIQSKFFYARILEYGRKAQTVKARRRRPVSGGVAVYMMRVKGIPANRYDFVRGRAGEFMQRTLGNELRGVLNRALKRLAAGG